MELLDGIILGIVQGLTEFLPISSSGHLILAREILRLQTDLGLSFDAVLQLATALAVLIYFWKTFWDLLLAVISFVRGKGMERMQKILLLALIMGTIPAVVLGLLLEGYMETTFRSAELVAVTLVIGALIMFVAEKFAKQSESLTVKKGLWVGFFQALALIPGMSRSGMTISGGLFFGLTRVQATRFSFLLAFPVILGSGLKKLSELGMSGALTDFGLSLLVGALAAFIIGMLSIHFLLQYLKNHTLGVFITYRLALAAGILIFL